jgi:hypothetical protein
MQLNLKDSTLPEKHYSDNEVLYFNGMNIASASIKLTTHDNAYVKEGVGVKRLSCIEKYEVDLLGNCNKVGKEKRRKFGK